MFVVVPSKANYNLLLGREWIHGIGAVPSTVHQMMFFWDNYGNLELIKGDEDYFRCEVNNADFDKNLSNIEPMNVSNKGEFYLKYPAQVQLSTSSLCVNRTCNYTLASRMLEDAGANYTTLECECHKEEEYPYGTSHSHVVGYDKHGTSINQTTGENLMPYPPPRSEVNYPDIQPTGWGDEFN